MASLRSPSGRTPSDSADNDSDFNVNYSLNDYQRDTFVTAQYPQYGTGSERALVYTILKLNGEAGECAEAVGKHLRGDYDWDTLISILSKELGDVLWYIANASNEIGLGLADVAFGNINKLRDRSARNLIRGSGDDR